MNRDQIIAEMCKQYRAELESLTDAELNAQVNAIDQVRNMTNAQWREMRERAERLERAIAT